MIKLHRRRFLALAVTSADFHSLPAWTMGNAISRSGDVTGKHLNLAAAKAIASEFLRNQQQSCSSEGFGDDLDISGYSGASLDALEYLANLEGGFAYIGVTDITPDMAKIFKGWKSYFLCFERIKTLDFEAAVQLGDTAAGHSLCFAQRMRVDAQTVEALCRNGSVINMKFHNMPDLSLARALATHDHEMFLDFPSADVSDSAAKGLSNHRGYLLQLSMPKSPSQSVLREFASNSVKRLTIHSANELNTKFGTDDHNNCLISLSQNLKVWHSAQS